MGYFFLVGEEKRLCEGSLSVSGALDLSVDKDVPTLSTQHLRHPLTHKYKRKKTKGYI